MKQMIAVCKVLMYVLVTGIGRERKRYRILGRRVILTAFIRPSQDNLYRDHWWRSSVSFLTIGG